MRNRRRLSIQALLAGLALSACGGSDGGYEVRITWDSRPDNGEWFPVPGLHEDFLPSDVFAAEVTAAPPHGALISGLIRLEVVGRNMRRVELLPDTGYAPVYVRFLVSQKGDYAYADFDTRTVANGALPIRISAFNRAAGESGTWEVIAMRPRTWHVLN